MRIWVTTTPAIWVTTTQISWSIKSARYMSRGGSFSGHWLLRRHGASIAPVSVYQPRRKSLSVEAPDARLATRHGCVCACVRVCAHIIFGFVMTLIYFSNKCRVSCNFRIRVLSKVELVKIAPPFQLVEQNY